MTRSTLRPLASATARAWLLAPMLGAAALSAGAAMPREGALADNAALDYLTAAAMAGSPNRPEDFEKIRFVRDDLARLPPKVLLERPDEARWLLGETGLVGALRRARGRERCEFPTRTPGSPFLDLTHLPVIHAAARRALAVAKAYEYAENSEGAAQIYVDLLRLVENVENDRNLSSTMLAVDLMQEITDDLEGFLSRDPPGDAAETLAKYFIKAKRPVFHLGDDLKDEGQRYARWLAGEGGTPEQKLALLYGRDTPMVAVDKLVTLAPEKKSERFRSWVMDYEIRMIRLGDALDKPYTDAAGLVRDLDGDKATPEAAGHAAGGNPFYSLLIPSMGQVHDRVTLAEAQFAMLQVMSMAAHHRAKLGRWPVSLDEVTEWAAQALPADPFSGKPFYYKLVQVRPRMVTRVPKWMARRDDLLYILDMSRRRERDLAEYNTFMAAPAPQQQQPTRPGDAVPKK